MYATVRSASSLKQAMHSRCLNTANANAQCTMLNMFKSVYPCCTDPIGRPIHIIPARWPWRPAHGRPAAKGWGALISLVLLAYCVTSVPDSCWCTNNRHFRCWHGRKYLCIVFPLLSPKKQWKWWLCYNFNIQALAQSESVGSLRTGSRPPLASSRCLPPSTQTKCPSSNGYCELAICLYEIARLMPYVACRRSEGVVQKDRLLHSCRYPFNTELSQMDFVEALPSTLAFLAVLGWCWLVLWLPDCLAAVLQCQCAIYEKTHSKQGRSSLSRPAFCRKC
jgi:hypothetical protein